MLLSLILKENKQIDYIKISLLVITFILYSVVFTWKFAILLMFAIGWHESGHVWAMHKVGVGSIGFYYLPFLGGVSISKEKYLKLSDHIIVVIMGPIWGMLLACITWVTYLITNNPILGAAAWWQACLNLFNLLPIGMLDGGQIFKSILDSFHKKAEIVFGLLSVCFVIFLLIVYKSPIFIFILILSIQEIYSQFKYNSNNYIKKLTGSQILTIIASYIILVTILLLVISSLNPTNDPDNFNQLFLK